MAELKPGQVRRVIETSASPYAALSPVPLHAIRLLDGFWKPRLDANVQAGLPALHRQLAEHHVLDAFRRISGTPTAPRPTLPFTDSDLYKWIEGVCFVLQTQPAPELSRLMEEAIDVILPAQQPDGYLDTYYTDGRWDERYASFYGNNMLYSAGHLFQAAVADHRTTGDERLLVCARRFADHLAQVLPGIPGAYADHPEIELGLVELYRETGHRPYLDLARFLLDARSFGELQVLAGHAVRATYFACGGADYYAETGERSFIDSLHRQWQNMLAAKLYITGALGGRFTGESVGKDYELPNAPRLRRDVRIRRPDFLGMAYAGAGTRRGVHRRHGARLVQRLPGWRVARRHALLLREPPAFRWAARGRSLVSLAFRGPPRARGLVRLHLLPDERGTPAALRAGLFLQHRRGWALGSPLRQQRARLAPGRWLATAPGPADALPVGRPGQPDRDAGAAAALYAPPPHPRLDRRRGRERGRQRRARGRRRGAGHLPGPGAGVGAR